MTQSSTPEPCDLGMVGLGVMGLNLALNLSDHGYSVAGYDLDPARCRRFDDLSRLCPLTTASSLPQLVTQLKSPRVVIILVPAGPPVDAVIRDLLLYLQPGDLLIDGGNSHYTDTDLRAKMLADRGFDLLGLGISGGEEGARHGPSLMAGGPREAYERVRPLLEAVAAQVEGEPCAGYLGTGSAGHYVKMMHNGIEYGLLQLISETYDLMRRGLGLEDDELHQVYADWSGQEVGGYLLDITARIFLRPDEPSGGRLIDVIRGVAGQSGTGMWASQDAMNLHLPIPCINTAVEMRDLSTLQLARIEAGRLYSGPLRSPAGSRGEFLGRLRGALYAGMLTTYAQGMDELYAASRAHDYGLQLEQVTRLWRGGCIIRARLLDLILQAYRARPDLPHLLLSPLMAPALQEHEGDLRATVVEAAQLGLPAPGLMAALGYYDAFRSVWLPDNLIQAQRDYFGAHNYERTDTRGTFHTHWQEPD